MRVRDHIVLATVGAALLAPWLGPRRTAAAWAGSVLIDIDHYIWFVANEGRLDPIAALSFFNEAQPPPATNVRIFHGPVALGAMAALSIRWKALWPVTLGMAAHVAADRYHDARLSRVRAAVLRRDGFTCQECGVRDETVTAHMARQPRVMPSYKPGNFVALCGTCHAAALGARAPVESRRVRRLVLTRA